MCCEDTCSVSICETDGTVEEKSINSSSFHFKANTLVLYVLLWFCSPLYECTHSKLCTKSLATRSVCLPPPPKRLSFYNIRIFLFQSTSVLSCLYFSACYWLIASYTRVMMDKEKVVSAFYVWVYMRKMTGNGWTVEIVSDGERCLIQRAERCSSVFVIQAVCPDV